MVVSRGLFDCMFSAWPYLNLDDVAVSQTSQIHSHALKRSRRRGRMKGSFPDFSLLALSVPLSLKKVAVTTPPDLLQMGIAIFPFLY